MTSFLRQLGTRLQTSSSARYILYGTAAAGTGVGTWRYHAQSRNERLQKRNGAWPGWISDGSMADILSFSRIALASRQGCSRSKSVVVPIANTVVETDRGFRFISLSWAPLPQPIMVRPLRL